MFFRSLARLALVAAPFCSQVAPDTPKCLAPPTTSSLSRVVDEGPFSVTVPMGDTALYLPGVDSQGGGWGRNGVRLVYDYGLFSNSLDSLPGLTELHRCVGGVGNRPAVLVTGRDSASHFVVAAHWPNLHHSSMGRISLTMYG